MPLIEPANARRQSVPTLRLAVSQRCWSRLAGPTVRPDGTLAPADQGAAVTAPVSAGG